MGDYLRLLPPSRRRTEMMITIARTISTITSVPKDELVVLLTVSCVVFQTLPEGIAGWAAETAYRSPGRIVNTTARTTHCITPSIIPDSRISALSSILSSVASIVVITYLTG